MLGEKGSSLSDAAGASISRSADLRPLRIGLGRGRADGAGGTASSAVVCPPRSSSSSSVVTTSALFASFLALRLPLEPDAAGIMSYMIHGPEIRKRKNLCLWLQSTSSHMLDTNPTTLKSPIPLRGPVQ